MVRITVIDRQNITLMRSFAAKKDANINKCYNPLTDLHSIHCTVSLFIFVDVKKAFGTRHNDVFE